MNIDRVFEMNKTEFYECIGRVAEVASLPNTLLNPVKIIIYIRIKILVLLKQNLSNLFMTK